MDCDQQNSTLISFVMIIWLRNLFDILPQHVEEQIMTSKENMTWNFINNKISKHVSEVNGNGG